MMNRFATFLLLSGIAFFSTAKPLCVTDACCGGHAGGISYCDSSSGRFVCNNGDYSVCYCTRHAVMDLQKLEGCCLWQGGVLKMDELGMIVCRDGTTSELCSLQTPKEQIVSW